MNKTDIFQSPYDLICAMEEASLMKRFLPYSKGSPSRSVTYDDQYDRANIIFFSDSHIDFRNQDESLDNVKRTIGFANSCPIPMDAIVNAGDAITPFQVNSKENALSRAEKFFGIAKESRVPFVFAKGNHDLNDWGNYPENAFTDRDWSNIFYDFAEERYGIVRQIKKSGEKSTWHYYDIEDKKIRIISVDNQDTDKTIADAEGKVKYYGGKYFYISNEQMNWIAHTALNFDDKEEKDWGVIVTFHQIPGDKEEYQNAVKEFIKLCGAFNRCETYSNNYVCHENSFFDMSVDVDFTRYASLEKKPHMICGLVGHMHEDKTEVHEGITFIWIVNGSSTDVASDARIVRIPGTSVQNCFDILNIDTRKRKIRMFRYGAGVNCYGVGGDRFLPDGLDY